MQATLNAKALAAVSFACSQEQIRRYLCGVRVTVRPTYVEYVATDGHLLLGCKTDNLGDDNTLLGSWIIPEAFCRLKTKSEEFTLSVRGELLELSDTHSAHAFLPINDGTFPDWRRIVPKGNLSGEVAQYDSALLIRVSKAAGIYVTRGKAGSSHRVAHNGDRPALVGFGAGIPEALFGVLSPYRCDPSVSVPAWV